MLQEPNNSYQVLIAPTLVTIYLFKFISFGFILCLLCFSSIDPVQRALLFIPVTQTVIILRVRHPLPIVSTRRQLK